MKTKTIKKAGLALSALAFGLTPLFTISQTVHAEGSESNNKTVYCDTNTASLFTAICTGEKPALLNTSTDRYIDITMHAGEYGHFEDDTKDRTATYFYNDTFNDNARPISERSDYAFVGWSTRPEATEVDVEVGEMRAAAIGTDLYAVWSNKAYVVYNVTGGVWDAPDGEMYSQIMMEYDVSANFRPLDPEPRRIEHYYDFVGWTTQSFGGGEEYTAETPVTDYYTEVYTEWEYNPDKVENEMILDEVYDISAGVSVPLYQFTPEEDGWYEIYTDGIEDDGTDRQGMLRLLDAGDHTLGIEQYIDPSTADGEMDVHTYYEMEAGETYYIRLGEMSGMYLRFDAGIRKAETTTVTFNTNRGADVWFDDDGSQSSTKEVEVPIGDDVANRRFEDIEFGDDSITLTAWTAEPDGEVHSALIVTGTMTVYAQYREMVAITLDYNGGYDPFDREETSYVAKFDPSEQFYTPMDPKRDEPNLRFVGWSVDQNATTPDPEVVEGKDSAATLAEWLDGRTLYAVYGEPVSVTFNATGGSWMMDDPSITTYESSVGEGHIFYGMAIMHYHPYVEHAGWIDQNGVFTMATSGVDGTYHVNEDSVFTSVLKYKMLAIGNGGRFPNGGLGGAEKLVLRLSYDGWQSTFSYDEAIEILGDPIPDDESKRFIGFATDPDATEPDIIDGETPLEDLGTIYAIWSDNEEEPEPEPEPASGEESPEVPNTGANFIAENHTAITTCSGLIIAIATIGLITYCLIHRRNA